MGREVDEQNKHINRIINKTDKVDDQVSVYICDVTAFLYGY